MSGRWLMSRVGFLGLMVVAVACRGEVGSGAEETRGQDALADLVDSRGEVSSPLALVCPAEVLDGPVAPLLPRPSKVFRLEEPVALAGLEVAWSGETGEMADELAALAAARGLVPAAGEASLEIFFHPLSTWEDVVANCDSLEAVDGSYYLQVEVTDGRAVVDIAAGEPAGRFYALKTLRQLLVPGEAMAIRPATIYDRPAVATRGVLEGYYGKPWPPEDRLAMVVEAAHLKFNTYVYAPKGAGTINTGWMLPFEADELAHFAQLVEVAERNYVQVCFEIHPSLLFHYSTESDFDTLLGKFETVIGLGIDCVVLAFDDVPPELVPPDGDVFASYTEAQVDFLPRLGEALLAAHPDLKLAYVPVEYFTEHEHAAAAWTAFGEALQPAWEIAWTGQQIGSPTVTLADAQEATALMGRKPLLGDNYPVSDDAYKTGLVHLGPIMGRGPDLATGVSGFAFNAMPLAHASLPALATCADYSWNPGAYDPQQSAANAARFYGGEAGQSGFLTLMLANRSPMLEGSHAPELEEAIAAFWAAREGQGDVSAAADQLRAAFFGPYAVVPAALAEPGMHLNVAGQLMPWAEALGGYGAAGEEGLDLLAASAAGEAFDTQNFVTSVDALATGFARPTGSAMDDFLARVVLELE